MTSHKLSTKLFCEIMGFDDTFVQTICQKSMSYFIFGVRQHFYALMNPHKPSKFASVLNGWNLANLQ